MVKKQTNISKHPGKNVEEHAAFPKCMKFKLRHPPAKEETIYKTLYIKRSLASCIEQIAIENETSFNNVVVSMIESCLEEE